MKNLIICATLLLMLVGCDEQSHNDVTRVIKNSSSVQVSLDGYLDGILESYILQPNDSLLTTMTYSWFTGTTSCEIQHMRYDSLVMVFNNYERQLVFCAGLYEHCVSRERGILYFDLNSSTNQGGYVESPVYTFTYTITKEDYLSAIPIGD